MNIKFGWKPDLPDQRDYTFVQLTNNIKSDKLFSFTEKNLPPFVSLRYWCSEIEDQKTLGSCVANAVVGLMEFNKIKSGLGGKKFKHFSRLFNYYNARVFAENVEEDSGAYIRDGIKTAKVVGICLAEDWPYRVEYFKKEPPEKCYQNALQYKFIKYYRLSSLSDMKISLANGHPFVFGVAIYQSFMTGQVSNTGVVPMPGFNERLLGGHAMLAIGYDDNKKSFLVRNSWGKSWGLKEGNLGGYCYIPYDYLSSRDLSDDFWTAY
jgi:C1A family cysteine protease